MYLRTFEGKCQSESAFIDDQTTRGSRYSHRASSLNLALSIRNLRFESRGIGVVRPPLRRVPENLVRRRHSPKLLLRRRQRRAAAALPLIGVPHRSRLAVPAANLLRRRRRRHAEDLIKRIHTRVHAGWHASTLVRTLTPADLIPRGSRRGEHLLGDLRGVRRRGLCTA